jgi:hypothetical protein
VWFGNERRAVATTEGNQTVVRRAARSRRLPTMDVTQDGGITGPTTSRNDSHIASATAYLRAVPSARFSAL